MKIVIFGLAVSSSWGNGHATLWRGLIKALTHLNHRVTFFEKDAPYYASHRDLHELPGGSLVLYDHWANIRARAVAELADADVAMITSYCPDATAATELVLADSRGLRVFYDLDTPVTLANVREGKPVDYVGPDGLAGFDLVLSYTGGRALGELRDLLHARAVAPLYGSVDPEVHRPVAAVETYRSDLSYLGTYAEDRQRTLETLFVDTARRMPDARFVIGGSMYPADFPWTDNIYFVRHMAPTEHPAFFCSSRLTLNVTRGAMADLGYCPSGRLFEAAACGVPIVTDHWEGLDRFYAPGTEILVCRNSDDVMDALRMPPDRLVKIALAARRRTLEEHTALHRAKELESILAAARTGVPRPAGEEGGAYAVQA
jgi:spore maturation protein CgeB